MMHAKSAATLVAAILLSACASTSKSHSQSSAAASRAGAAPAAITPESAVAAIQQARDQVVATERAFAKTMAVRDFNSFVRFLSPEAVFFSGNEVRHGAAEVAAQWAPYFDAPDAPFSWAPDHVEVLASGKLAQSTGPVYQQGKVVGRFNSVWRLEAPNTWRIVFDKGEAVCSTTP